MKYIYLLRHAKSDWDTPFTTDHERGLAKRGIKSIELLREFIDFKKLKIDYAFISDAKRTQETYFFLVEELSFVKDYSVVPELYDTTVQTYFQLLHGLNNTLESVLFVGHNPEIEQVGNFLLGNVSSESLFFKFPTCGFLGLGLDYEDWRKVKDQTKGKLIFFFTPSKGNIE